MVVLAKEFDRLEVLYFENHDTSKVSYVDFLMENSHLLGKDLLENGDEVILIDEEESQEVQNNTNVTVVQRQRLW